MVAVENEEDEYDDETGLTLTAVTKQPMYVVTTKASLRRMSCQAVVVVCHRALWHGGGPFARAQHNRKRQRPCTTTLMDGALVEGWVR